MDGYTGVSYIKNTEIINGETIEKTLKTLNLNLISSEKSAPQKMTESSILDLEFINLPTRIKSEPIYYGECKVCGGGLLLGRKAYCSVECRSIDCRTSFRCDYCGQTKEILQSIYEVQKKRGYKYMYCSISCRNFGRWEALKLQPVNVS